MKLNTSIRKKFRVGNKLKKVAKVGRFRLSIFRSTKNISAQIIDDKKNITLLSASSIEKDIKETTIKNKYECLANVPSQSTGTVFSSPWQPFPVALHSALMAFTEIIQWDQYYH